MQPKVYEKNIITHIITLSGESSGAFQHVQNVLREYGKDIGLIGVGARRGFESHQ